MLTQPRHKWLSRGGMLVVAALVLGTTQAPAAGLLVADGGFGGVLQIEEHTASVTINNGVAVTEVTQVFRNTENRQVEALYMFPVPKGASVANFSMWINGKEMIGEVLEKKRARKIYESYKQTRRDPGLLEQVDYKTFEMRIFPIGPEARQKVRIVYYQELDFDHDWANYVYPLATAPRAGLDTRTQGKFGLTMQVKSAVPIMEMESPSHGKDFVIVKHAESLYEASLETDGGNLARDLVLAYRVSRPMTGVDLITSRQRGEDGFFALTLTAGKELAKLNKGMDYIFILDISGSMAHDGKLRLSRESIGAFINELDKEDRFEVVTFNVAPNTLFNQARPVTDKAKAEALEFLGSQQARGGTKLRSAMATAYKYGDPDRQLNVVILSDGMTEQKERAELLQLIQTRPSNARVFCIGVGNEVNRPLLRQLAEDAGGLASFISRGDNFKRQAEAFRRKLMRPAASGVKIRFDGVEVYDVEPGQLPNLYHGMPLRLYGRYRGKGQAKVLLQADVNGAALEKTVPVEFPALDANNPEIERMWASHKVDRLLRQANRAGSPTSVINEIVRLGEGFSIVTEYTSFLVLENDAEYKRWKIERRNLLRVGRDRQRQQVVQSQLEALRDQAMADLGPTAGNNPDTVAQQAPVSPPVTNTASSPTTIPSQASNPDFSVRRRRGGGGFGEGFGGGAIDPITGTFILSLAGLGFTARRRRKENLLQERDEQ